MRTNALGAYYLTNGQLAIIEKWIKEGAPEHSVVANPNLFSDTTIYSSPEFVVLEPPESGYQYHLGPFNILPQREGKFYIMSHLNLLKIFLLNGVKLVCAQAVTI